jgi:hypothetical protein
MKARVPTPALILCGGLLLCGGCRQKTDTLQLADLTAGERLYFEQVVAVERAKAVALIHRDLGASLLDSLATAWGDSVQPELLAGLTHDPNRSVAVGELLLRVVTAEQDSLLRDPGTSRLHLPLPDPNRPGAAPVPAATPDSLALDSET